MKWLIIFFLLAPAYAFAQDIPYQRPEGKIVKVDGEEGIFFNMKGYAEWGKIYVDYRNLSAQAQPNKQLELAVQKLEDLYDSSLKSCEMRFKTEEKSVTFWQARTDAERDARFKLLKSACLGFSNSPIFKLL